MIVHSWLFIFFFFFFKQKTAYEMRISDWSSDVCSSDLALTRQYVLGNPLHESTTLGPLVKPAAAEFVRGQIAEAVAKGAKALLDPSTFAADRPGGAYLAPQVLVDVDHRMAVMREESFGPVVGIMPVASEAEEVGRASCRERGGQ